MTNPVLFEFDSLETFVVKSFVCYLPSGRNLFYKQQMFKVWTIIHQLVRWSQRRPWLIQVSTWCTSTNALVSTVYTEVRMNFLTRSFHTFPLRISAGWRLGGWFGRAPSGTLRGLRNVMIMWIPDDRALCKIHTSNQFKLQHTTDLEKYSWRVDCVFSPQSSSVSNLSRCSIKYHI